MEKDFLCEEVRSDFLVTTERKKIWAAELDILEKFDKLCRENGLKYFAAYGTLLGAVRHHGYIPWDDDLDVFMLRDDYDKFEQLAHEYFRAPYEFQGFDNGYVLSAHTKIRNANTTAIEYTEAPLEYNQGIFIDVFPLDDAADDDKMNPVFLQVQELLWKIAAHPQEMLKVSQLGQKFILDADLVEELCRAGTTETIKQLEIFCSENFGQSTKVNFLTDEIYHLVKPMDREWFSDMVYMPFENTEIPVPVGYAKVLEARFGQDYMTPKQLGAAHSCAIMDAEKPYTEYIQKKADE